MSGSMESSASWDGEGAVALLTRMSDDEALEPVDADLDEGEDGLLDDPEDPDDDDLLEGDDDLDDELVADNDDDDDLDDELIDLDDEYDVGDDDDKAHPGRFDE